MGEKIKDIGKIKISSYSFDVELNEGNKNEKYNIHIQNDVLKLSYKEYEFAKLVACFMGARKRFEGLKGMRDE